MKKTIIGIIFTVLIFLMLLSLFSCGLVKKIGEETTKAETTAAETATPETAETKATQAETTENAEAEETQTSETTEAQTSAVQAYVPTGNGRAPLALMYHLILDEPYSALEGLFVRPSELRGHIEALLDAGYTFIFADEYTYSDEKTVIMSFDDGYIDNYTEMFPIIKEYNVKVTVFMVSGYIDGADFLSEDMIKEMAQSGLVSFQSHTASHAALQNLSEDSLRYEFSASVERIESITGRKVKAICYPAGGYNETVTSVASEFFEFGYTTVSTNSTAGYPLLELPRLRINRGISKETFAAMIP